MHQKDKAFVDVLNTIRVKVPEKDTEVEKILQSCQVNVNEDHPSCPKNAMHVHAQNEPAMIRNDKMLMDLEGTMYISKARHFKKDV